MEFVEETHPVQLAIKLSFRSDGFSIVLSVVQYFGFIGYFCLWRAHPLLLVLIVASCLAK